jgi:O-antigen/teichoic acid export membrane protein
VGVNIFVAIAQLVSIRYIYRWLGESAYAIYVVVIAFVGYANLLAPSASYGVLRRLVERLRDGDLEGAARLQRAQSAMVLGITAVGSAVLLCFGMFYTVPGAHLDRTTTLDLFLAGTAVFILNQINQILEPILAALELFRGLALRSACDRLTGATVGMFLAFQYHSPFAVLVGRACGSAVSFVSNIVSIRLARHPYHLAPGRHPEEQRDLLNFARLGYPHRVLGGAANSADRILYSYSGRPLAEVSRYAIAYRVPEMIQSMFIDAADAVVPRLASDLTHSAEAAGALIDKSARAMLMIGVSFVMVPSAFGSALLKVWLGQVPAGTPVAWALLGGYFALQIYMTVLSKAFYALGRLDKAAVFTGANALVTVLFTIPVARWNGIVGVATMNLAISGVLFVPYAFWTQRSCAPSFEAASHVRATVQIVLIGCLFSISGFVLSEQNILLIHPILSTLIAVAWAITSATVIVSLRLADIPETYRRFVAGLPARMKSS